VIKYKLIGHQYPMQETRNVALRNCSKWSESLVSIQKIFGRRS